MKRRRKTHQKHHVAIQPKSAGQCSMVGLRNPDYTYSASTNRSIFRRFLTGANVGHTVLVGVALAIFAATFWLYWPSTHGAFLKVDDMEYLRQSMRWDGLTWNAVKWALMSTDAYYQPLVRLSHVLDYQLWGSNAAGHHATSVFWHAFNAALVFGFLWTLLGTASLTAGERLSVALWAAMVFAFHPLQAESVAWMAVRTQLLCTTFGIGCLWAYVAGARRWVWGGLYVAALLCKPTAVALPFLMLVIDYFPLRRHQQMGWGPLVREKAAMIALAAVSGMATVFTEPRGDGLIAAVPLSVRAIRAFESLTFYPWKLDFPFHLSPNYVSDVSLGAWMALASVLTVILISVVAVVERRRIPVLATGWAAYLLLVLPTSPLMPNGRQVVAMRYAYEAIVPMSLLVGAAGIWLWRRTTPAVRAVLVGLMACELCAFATVTRCLIPDWQNDETMRRATLEEFPESAEANRVLAMELSDEERAGAALVYAQRSIDIAPQMFETHVILERVLCKLDRFPEAIQQGEQALQIAPNSVSANCEFGLILMKLGRLPEAVEHYQRALRLNPNLAEAHCNLGIALAQAGLFGEAIGHFERAVQIDPYRAESHADLGNALAQSGKTEEAITHYEQALRINHNLAETQSNLGTCLMDLGMLGESIKHFEQALRIKPDYAEAHNNLATALAQTGKTEEAIAHYEQALRIEPEYAGAHCNFGVLLAQTADIDDAIAHYVKALRIKPDYAEAHNNLGLALAQRGDIEEAVAHYQQALRINPDYTEACNNLGLALKKMDRTAEAVAH